MASVFDIDFEAGNLNEFDSTGGAGLATFDAHVDAAMVGSYGMRCIGAGAEYGKIAVGVAEVWFGFHVYIDPSWSMAQYTARSLLWMRTNTYYNRYFAAQRYTSGTGPPTHWELGGVRSTTNFSTGVQHWVVIRFHVADASTGGYQVWVDGTLVIDNAALDWSGYTTVLDVALGMIDNIATSEYAYFDSFLADDAGAPTEPTAGGASALPIIMQMHDQLAGGM